MLKSGISTFVVFVGIGMFERAKEATVMALGWFIYNPHSLRPTTVEGINKYKSGLYVTFG